CSALGRESEQIEENTSAGSLVLALDVATRILGAAPTVTPDQLSEVQPVLADTLGHANRITLAMHPDDLAQLQRLVADEGLAWPDHPRIQFKADPSLSRGALRPDIPETREGAGEEQVMDALHRLLGESDS
ncbi:MAG: hypothetical protein KFF50_04430, partial [Desulfatitalea sp.]|nr:hypothetical protein [Desulfatitalea sp.]